jgi:hypothetical protein
MDLLTNWVAGDRFMSSSNLVRSVTVRVKGELSLFIIYSIRDLAHLLWMMPKSPSPGFCYPDPAHTPRLPSLVPVVFQLAFCTAGDGSD